ncbi:LysR substrate-binding domain-containing protein [Roseovarius sp. EL26]|uniref:LysR substrate-binding domain-containing protein n=1 Tax=Roseovarius sp. EL26 TaxID=2126672 RepID=UPI000EA03160|nr:LysR substrate-binding domain-containing protein [Roseovarius sp. EL26]
MSDKHYGLPSLSALASFEAAARHVGFKAAAAELNVTPAAVSHQIKALEQELGKSLFHRHQRGVELTETGISLFLAVQRGLGQMSDAVQHIRATSARQGITIRATTAVSSLWLTPLLAKFWRTHGHVVVTQQVTDTAHSAAECDLVVRYADMSRETGPCQSLFKDHIIALASPNFLKQYPIKTLSDLAHAPLIQLHAEDQTWTTWPQWAQAFGYDGALGEGLHVNNYTIALQAAQDDMGVVLGWERLTRPLIDQGTLVQILPHRLETPQDFYVKLRRNAPANAKVLRDWLLQRARNEGIKA